MLTRSCVQVIVLEELFDHVEVGRDHHGSVAHVEPDQGAVLFNLPENDKVYFELVGSMGRHRDIFPTDIFSTDTFSTGHIFDGHFFDHKIK